MRVIKADFDKATAQPWSPVTCLVAQCMIRHGVTPDIDGGARNPAQFAIDHDGMALLMGYFDYAYVNAKQSELKQIRASLPDEDKD